MDKRVQESRIESRIHVFRDVCLQRCMSSEMSLFEVQPVAFGASFSVIERH